MTQPSIEFISPWSDPVQSVRASKVEEMYDFEFIPNNVNFIYDVGVMSQIEDRKIYIRNKSLSHDLSITIILPSYLKTEDFTTFIIPKEEIRVLTINLDEIYVKEYTKVAVKPISKSIAFQVVPLNVAGPVYIRTGLSPLLNVIK